MFVDCPCTIQLETTFLWSSSNFPYCPWCGSRNSFIGAVPVAVRDICRLDPWVSSQAGKNSDKRREARHGHMYVSTPIPQDVGLVAVDDVVATGGNDERIVPCLREELGGWGVYCTSAKIVSLYDADHRICYTRCRSLPVMGFHHMADRGW